MASDSGPEGAGIAAAWGCAPLAPVVAAGAGGISVPIGGLEEVS